MINSFEAAGLNAHIASTVAMVNLDLSVAHFKGLSLHVVFMLIPMLHNNGRKDHGRILEVLAKIVESGELKPILDKETFTLEQASHAHARLESGNALGKVVISVA